MNRRTFGPHRGADWLGRVAYPEATHKPAFERFTLRLKDPRHPRALWVSWTIDHGHSATGLRVDVVFFDALHQTRRQLRESWPLARLLVDPERMGLGVGECHLGQGTSFGLVREQSHALAWEAQSTASGPGLAFAPSDGWLTGRRLDPKFALVEPGTTLHSGFIELWDTLGRQAEKRRIDTRGWHVSVTHSWGHGSPRPYAALHAHGLAAGDVTHLDVVSCPIQIMGLLKSQATLGVVRCSGASTRFLGWQHLRRGSEPRLENQAWAFTLEQGSGHLEGEVTLSDEHTATVSGPQGTRLHVTEQGLLKATFKRRGHAPQAIQAERVSFEAAVVSSGA